MHSAALGRRSNGFPHFSIGWAHAGNTPFQWTKQYASFLGGIRNGMILSWKGHVAHPGAVCSQFAHLNDMAPTILDAARDYVTMGEMCDAWREVWGTWRETPVF